MSDSNDLVQRLKGSSVLSAKSRLAHDGPLRTLPSVLCGIRGTYKPTIALRTIQRMGAVRHALAQRSIAGCMEVHAPFSDHGKDEKRK